MKTKLARRLRKIMTPAERRLWAGLRRRQIRGAKFRRQQPIGPFVVDFACLEARLIVEADGANHASSLHDLERDRWLTARGYDVLRFANKDILRDTPRVLEAIGFALRDRPPSSRADARPTSPSRGEEKV